VLQIPHFFIFFIFRPIKMHYEAAHFTILSSFFLTYWGYSTFCTVNLYWRVWQQIIHGPENVNNILTTEQKKVIESISVHSFSSGQLHYIMKSQIV
jgi:hypothetical protein